MTATGPEHFRESLDELDAAFPPGVSLPDEEKIAALLSSLVSAVHAQTAVNLMIAENMGDYPPYEVDAWREVIPRPPLMECKGREVRRPECAERHTEDCAYADPIPEPKHELLDVGTRVLVSERATKYPDGTIVYDGQPRAAKIVGYDLHHSKYQLNVEEFGGGYYDFVTWAFADNRVQPHPEQDGAVAEPTGPRLYVQKFDHSKQGHVVEFAQDPDKGVCAKVQWYTPGTHPVWVSMDLLKVVAPENVDRCENGQTGDNCGSGENQCALCLAAEDDEADAIERGMGLR